MSCALFVAKPLPEPILIYCQFDSWELISMRIESHYHIIISNICLKMATARCWPFCFSIPAPRSVWEALSRLAPIFLANFPWKFSQSNWKNHQQHSSLVWLRYGCPVWVQNRIFIAILWESIALDKINSAVICFFSKLLWSESCISCQTIFTGLYVMHYWYRHVLTIAQSP